MAQTFRYLRSVIGARINHRTWGVRHLLRVCPKWLELFQFQIHCQRAGRCAGGISSSSRPLPVLVQVLVVISIPMWGGGDPVPEPVPVLDPVPDPVLLPVLVVVLYGGGGGPVPVLLPDLYSCDSNSSDKRKNMLLVFFVVVGGRGASSS